MSWRTRFAPTVYLVTDPIQVGARGLAATVHAAVAGGATMVQLRDPEVKGRALYDQAVRLRAELDGATPLIVNDRVDVAKAAGADGVHVGQDDLPAAEARRQLGPDAIVGLSVGSDAEALEIDPEVVDYVGVGPVFATPTKPDAGAALGVEGFAALRHRIPPGLPVVAIGGITVENAAQVFSAGADGVAVVSAICAAADPELAARTLFQLASPSHPNRRSPAPS